MNQIVKYWIGVVLKKAFADIWKFIKEPLSLTSLLVGAMIVSFWLSANGLIDRAIIDGYVSDVSSLVRLLIAAVALSVFYVAWGFVYFPVKIYHEQRERLKELDPDLAEIVLGEYNDAFRRDVVGIDIKNLTNENFEGVVELKRLSSYALDKYCDEREVPHPVDISNCHFEPFTIKRKDHQVIKLAELRELEDGKFVVFLTENDTRFYVELFFIRPDPIPEPEFIKIHFVLELEVRGKFKTQAFDAKYNYLVALRASREPSELDEATLGSRGIEATILAEEVSRVSSK